MTIYREDIIIPLVTDKKVLDCGGIDHWAAELKQLRGDWLHGIIAEHSSFCLGVDILEDETQKVNRQKKYNFLVANVEALPFKGKFDVIVAGEIVEHIYNMGLFLESAWEALVKEGILIITTPNCYSASLWLKAAFHAKERCHPEHTCYYSVQTLTYVVKRHGFKVVQSNILPRSAKSRIIHLFRNIIALVRPIFSETIFLIAKKMPMQDKYSRKW